MALNLPENAGEIDARMKADVQRSLATSNPFLKNSWLGAIITGLANRIYDFYLDLNEAIKQNYVFSATGDFLDRITVQYGIIRSPATQASGNVVATGVAGSVIPAGTAIGDYESTASATISDQALNAASIIRSGQTATLTTSGNHGLANNVEVTIAGATNAEYNGTYTITVTGLNTFTYPVSGSPADELTTSATVSFTSAAVPIRSVGFGQSTNLDAGTVLSLQSPIAGVDNSLVVDFGAIGGGTDAETDEALRSRAQYFIQNPVALFNVAAITNAARSIAGVSRVFVQEITPSVGQVSIYFMRDDDADPIPSASEVTKVNEAIQAIRPAHTAEVDVIVSAPTPVIVDFTFTSLSPNTATMKSAIRENLAQFFTESTDVGVNIDEDAYRSSIFNTIDTVTGARIISYALSSPAGDVPINTGEIGKLGTVTFL